MADNWNSSIDYVAIGERLKAYRIGASLQAEDVAEQLGVSRAVIYRIERGILSKLRRWIDWLRFWKRLWHHCWGGIGILPHGAGVV